MSWLKKRLPKKRWKRALVYIFSVFLILLAADMILVQCWRHIEIGHDTTRITAPLTATGYPDYIASLNNQLSAGVTPENNAAPLIFQLKPSSTLDEHWRKDIYARLGLPPDSDFKGMITFEEWAKTNAPKMTNYEDAPPALIAPWNRPDHPEWARWLDDQSNSLAVAHQAAARSNYYVPIIGAAGAAQNAPGDMIKILLPAVGAIRASSRGLSTRSMLRLSEGDTAGFETDVLDILKLSRLLSHGGTLIEYLVAIAVDTDGRLAIQSAATSGRLDAAAIARLRKSLADLPPLRDASFSIDVGERYNFLDCICLVSNGGPAALNYITELSAPGTPDPTHTFSNRAAQLFVPLNYNHMMRFANGYFDRMTAAVREPDYLRQKAGFDAIERDIIALKDRNIVVQLTDPAGLMVEIMMPALSSVAKMQAISLETANLTTVSLALAQYHLDHNAYPDSLADLALPTTVSTDLFTGTPLIYRRTLAGYILYSVGPNGKDDGGRTRKEAKANPLDYDIVVKAEK